MVDQFGTAVVEQDQWDRLANEADIVKESLDYFNEVEPQVEARERNSRAAHWSYWRVFTNPNLRDFRRDWIMIGPSPMGAHGNLKVEEFEKAMHAQRLDKYGDWSTYLHDPNYRNPIQTDREFAANRHPFGKYATMIKAGGIREFPISQIRAYGWHRNELVQKAYPEACVEPDHPCRYCPLVYAKVELLQAHMRNDHDKELAAWEQAQAQERIAKVQIDAQRDIFENLAQKLAQQSDGSQLLSLIKALRPDLIEEVAPPVVEDTPEPVQGFADFSDLSDNSTEDVTVEPAKRGPGRPPIPRRSE